MEPDSPEAKAKREQVEKIKAESIRKAGLHIGKLGVSFSNSTAVAAQFVGNQLREAMLQAEHSSAAERASAFTELQALMENHDDDWQAEFGEPFPKTIEEWKAFQIRIQMGAGRTFSDTASGDEMWGCIRAYLKGLKERRAGQESGQADKKTDKPQEKEKKLPPNDVNNAARYIREQRKLIKAGRRPTAGKKALIEEHVVGNQRKMKRLEKELQPSRYGHLLYY